MDVEAWIIGQLEPLTPEAPSEMTFDGPAGLIMRVEVDWFETDSPGRACRGVTVEVNIAGRLQDDLSRLRTGHRGKNMAVRHFAINLVRHANDKKTIKLRRKLAGWADDYLASILNAPAR